MERLEKLKREVMKLKNSELKDLDSFLAQEIALSELCIREGNEEAI